MSTAPYLSIVLATHNRRDVVLRTLERLVDCGLAAADYEVIVVDNASSDGTADAVAPLRGVSVLRLERNLGACAKALGVDQARGAYVLFLDDDSFPRPGCLERMLQQFAADPELGAAGFTVHLPDGAQECSALPHVFVGCGVGLRADALRQAGGLDRSFFMAAEEYDLSFRLLRAGWRVEILADLQVDHLKSAVGRRSERLSFYDIRNNLRIVARYLPPPFARIYRDDWVQRYAWLAERAGHRQAYGRGLAAGRRLARVERRAYRSWRLKPEQLEAAFGWSRVEHRMRELRAQGIRRIVLADLGKNVYAYKRAADACGLEVPAIADDRFAAPKRDYRGVPIVPIEQALALGANAYAVSNTSYVHAARRQLDLSRRTDRPVYNWAEGPADHVPVGPESILA